MSSIYFVIPAAVCLSLVFTRLSRPIAFRVGAVDRPGPLSIHSQPTPRLGGLGLWAGFVGAVLIATLLGLTDLKGELNLFTLLLAFTLITITGAVDDIRSVLPRWKFAGELLGALLLICSGFKIGFLPLVYLSIPITLFYLLGGVNSVNFLDGMDGLVAGVSAIAGLSFGLLFLHKNDPFGAALAFALVGSCLGFLWYNFPPARVFMGDTGSLSLGFLLAVLAIRLASTPYDIRQFVAPLAVLAVPIVDTSAAILRRIVSKHSPFLGDRSHLYDLLGKRFSHQKTVLVFYLLSAACGLIGFLIYTQPF